MNRRLSFLLIIIGIALAGLLGRLFYLQLVMGDKYGRIARFNILRIALIPAPRGEIRDRKGRRLAYDIPRLNVCAVISEVDDKNVFARKLAPLIGYTPDKILKILRKNEDNPYSKVLIKSRVDTETMMKVAEIQGDLPGLHFEVQPVREYPEGELACHILGYVGEITKEELKTPGYKKHLPKDIIGKDGIEKYYDQYLIGKYGKRRYLVNAAGRTIRKIDQTKSKPGYNLYLTIDIKLQKKVEKILADYVQSLSRASGEELAGSVILMKNKTGEILAMASYPGFDPNIFSKGISAGEYKKLIERKDYPLLNRSIAGSYPAASTFKLITASAALQEGICTRYSPFYCPGRYKVGNQYFYCFVKTGHGKIDFHKSLSESCDVVYYFLGESLGIDRILKYCGQFGLGRKTGIDLPGESPGLLPNNYWKIKTFKEPWYTGDTVNLSIGQGFLGVTPLQMAVVTGIVANEGAMFKPVLVKRVERSDGKVLRITTPEASHLVKVKAQHFSAVKDGIREAVLTGTANRLRAPRLRFAGKTGTAEAFVCPENPRGRNHTWFVGMGPREEPEIILVVFLERSGGLAGKVAVPLASLILQAYEEEYLNSN